MFHLSNPHPHFVPEQNIWLGVVLPGRWATGAFYENNSINFSKGLPNFEYSWPVKDYSVLGWNCWELVV